MLIKLINRYIRSYWPLLIIVLLCQIAATIAALALPTLNADIIDKGVAKGDTDYILHSGLKMLGVSGLQIVSQIIAVYFGAQVAMKFGRDVRSAIFDRVLSFSSREINHFGAPSLITRNTNDVQQVQMLVLMTCILMIAAPIMMGGGVFMAVRQDGGLSWLIAAAVIVLGIGVGLIVTRMSPLFRQNQERIDTINRVLREQISGIRVIRAFVREPTERKRFQAANNDLLQLGLKIGTLFSILFPLVMFVMNISSVGVMWFGGHRIAQGQAQVGQLFSFTNYLMQILVSVMMATMMTVLVPRATVCAQRIMEVLNTPSTVVPDAHPITTIDQSGYVDLEHVEFSYPGAEEPVLKDINMTLRPGTTTAIIGATGSGKTTLINLIPRLYDATAGKVRIGGVDSRALDMDLLWSRIGLVPQKPYLFSGTVASNLRYGNPQATEEQMWAALKTAQAADFVHDMDGQLDAPITQGGTNVSGGQRQRLSIARALIKKPDIYIFDDAFSALDVATDSRLRASLTADTKNAAVLIVAQRVSTIRHADQIVVLDEGRVIGEGSHEELLANNPTYREIVDSQMSVEEATA